MLIKQKDDVQPSLDALAGLLSLHTLSRPQRESIEDEIDHIRAGARGEKDAAYHIDFTLKDARNWVVIHDLRLVHNGWVAQIDHLLIGRMFDLFVIESKNVKTPVRVKPGGEFEFKSRWGWRGMASPIEQNKRHIQVLSSLIDDEKLTPRRLGFHIRPTFHNWVLLAPECNFSRGKTEDATILKMDMFQNGLDKQILHPPPGAGFSLTKVCATETIVAFAEKLVSFHRPIVFDYAAKFGITPAQRYCSPRPVESESAQAPPVAIPICEECRNPVEPKVVRFCRSHEKRFNGRVLCQTCQAASPIVRPVPAATRPASAPTCQECGTPVDAKVVAFCRFNSRRFAKRVLCRACQTSVAAPMTEKAC